MSSRTTFPDRARLCVAVRALCEFTAKQGDLDLRFTPSATALEGMAGHLLAAARRGEGYEAELSLAGECGKLLLRGRADGYDPRANRLDEVKTYRGDLAAMPANRRHLHWAQARVYGALLCRARGLDGVELALVYVDVANQTETVLRDYHPAAALEAFMLELCSRFAGWAERQLAHRDARDAALLGLRFAHPAFRAGQRELSAAVWKAAVGGQCLLAQAPTGIGKTIATIFPLLKAWPGQRLDKLVFVTAKTPGRALALQALRSLGAGRGGLPLRVLELVARSKACEYPAQACHGDSCPLARGFYDRLPAARSAALESGLIDRAALRDAALAHQVCPYHLGQELVRWADVVVGDFNHWFDSSALLYGLAQTDGWRVGLLVDEAHNLVDRARAMYSGELRRSALRGLCPTLPSLLRGCVTRSERCWDALAAAQRDDRAEHDELPANLLAALQDLAGAASDHLAAPVVAGGAADPALLQLFFDVLQLLRLHDSHGSHSLIELRIERDDSGTLRDSVWCIRNVVPAPFLRSRWAASRCSVLFSATLQPAGYHRELLGLPALRQAASSARCRPPSGASAADAQSSAAAADAAAIDAAPRSVDAARQTVEIEIGSPFDGGQLEVRIADRIATRWRRRDQSLQPIAELIAQQFERTPGNYLAFFSSFDYLQQVADRLASDFPAIAQWRQGRAMDDAARDGFLARFTADGCGIGFAVLGGAFAEAIDLPGRRLIGAFVATLGLPQWNPVNQAISARIDAFFGDGRGDDYTYLFPGLQKVVQAAGRVVRTPEDRGVVWLIDDRYAQPRVRSLLPRWWRLEAP